VRTVKIWRLFQECARPDPKAPIQRLSQRNRTWLCENALV
jgi:hypothetical protein